MSNPVSPLDPGAVVSASRYELLATIASGGMATVYVGRLRGAGGFSRTVAVKRAHPHLLADPTYRTMLVDEARLAARLHHPNVVAVLDIEELAGELSLVMDYVEGSSLMELMETSRAAGQPLSPRIAMRVALDACAGLHAAHSLSDNDGQPLGLVHRDVSPQNILVGVDGVARLSDFGIAKSAEGVATTTGVLKGKLSYMAPEYLESTRLDARSDVFSLGVVVWEALAGQKLFRGKSELETFKKVVATQVPPLSSVASWANPRLDAILGTALARSPENRFRSAESFGAALETAARRDDLIATAAEVGACVRALFADALAERRAEVRRRAAQLQPDPAPSSATRRQDRSTPTPLPVERPPPSGESLVEASVPPPHESRRSAPTPEPRRSAPTPEPRRSAPAPEPAPASSDEVEVSIPTSSGTLWKGAIVVGLAAAVGGVIALVATQSGGDEKASPGALPTASASAVPVAVATPAPLPAPPPSASAAAIAGAAPAEPAAPSASAHRLAGKMPTRPLASSHAPSPAAFSTGVPLSAWVPSQPPPAPEPPDEPQ